MKYKFIPIINKVTINNKKRLNIEFKLLDFKREIAWFIQCDTNVWWFPKHIYKRKEKGLYYSWGWLFVQLGFMKFFEKKDIK